MLNVYHLTSRIVSYDYTCFRLRKVRLNQLRIRWLPTTTVILLVSLPSGSFLFILLWNARKSFCLLKCNASYVKRCAPTTRACVPLISENLRFPANFIICLHVRARPDIIQYECVLWCTISPLAKKPLYLRPDRRSAAMYSWADPLHGTWRLLCSARLYNRTVHCS